MTLAELLQGKISAAESRRNWAALPPSFAQDAIRAVRETLQPHFRGKGSKLIKARCALARADSFAGLTAAVTLLGESL